jgi:hypothetical protein
MNPHDPLALDASNSRELQQGAAAPPSQLTGLGKAVFGIAFLVTAAGVAIAAFTGVPIPFTSLVVHSVMISLILGAIPGLMLLGLASLICKPLGLTLIRTS